MTTDCQISPFYIFLHWFPHFVQRQKPHFTHSSLCLEHIQTLMLHRSVRWLKQSKASFVRVCALEFPSSSGRQPHELVELKVHGADMAFFLSWAAVSHTETPGDFAAVWEQWGWWRDSCSPHPSPPPPFHPDIWHTDIEDLSWNKHGVLCHSCDVCASELVSRRAENR